MQNEGGYMSDALPPFNSKEREFPSVPPRTAHRARCAPRALRADRHAPRAARAARRAARPPLPFRSK